MSTIHAMTSSKQSTAKPKRAGIVFVTDVEPLVTPQSFLDESKAFGLSFDNGDLERLGRYLGLLTAANKQVNLTSIREPEEAWRRHIFDSLTLMPLLEELPSGARITDVGSGGGTPGLPLAIAMPSLRMTLIEATAKKAQFLSVAAATLGLHTVDVVNDRAEAVAANEAPLREVFDVAIARALGPMKVAAELVLPLVRVGGRAIFIKGQKAEEELREAARAIETLGGAQAGVVDTPTGKIVVLEKVERTPQMYPRRPGQAKKEPIGERH